MSDRHIVAVLAMAFCLCLPAQAQLEMKVEIPHRTYLLFEPVPAKVTLRNVTDEELVLGSQPGEATFSFLINSRPDRDLRRRGTGPLVPRTVVSPGKSTSFEVELVANYGLVYEGEYIVAARLEWDNDEFTSRGAVVDVVPGLEVLSMKKHVPNYRKRIRNYSLRYLNREEELVLFLSIYDETERANYGVFPLGSFVRVTDPQISFDSKGFLKVVHQSQPNLYTHSYLESNRYGARMITQEFYDRDGRERFREEEEPEPEPQVPEKVEPTRKSFFDLLRF